MPTIQHHLVAIACLVSTTLTGCGNGNEDSSSTTLEVLDPTEVHYGKTYSEWNVEWFKWIYQMQLDDSCHLPVDDATGANCDIEQPDGVFFLAGNLTDTTTVVFRDKCVAPAGRPIFFPLMNLVADNGGVPAEQQLTDEDNRTAVQELVDAVRPESLFASVDDHEIRELERFKTEVVEFSYEVPPEPNFYTCLGAPGVTGLIDPSFAGGYYVMIAPLSKGHHNIRFGIDQADDVWASDITYDLLVE